MALQIMLMMGSTIRVLLAPFEAWITWKSSWEDRKVDSVLAFIYSQENQKMIILKVTQLKAPLKFP